ncbi:DUF72 domain-containing protein [Methylomarinovum caldicuralii]|uniref:DUF72 domain-containing protein n=1 Tax=Methylomarinovum caldicuralii TaxID=438856 RepID=UPI0029540D6A|nr:DUF72 domain-containing protein [Methylomarinovum caldicuralii]
MTRRKVRRFLKIGKKTDGNPAPEVPERRNALRIGTSGWHYPHWRGRYYPQDLPAAKWLAWHARDFDCVEVNNSFYRLPSVETVRQWCAQVPESFRFAVKASRLITHLKKLRQCEAALQAFLDVADAFGARLGPILFQLPPRWHVNPRRLAEFLALLPPWYEYAFEFRDPSWHCQEIYQLLERYQAAFCLFDLAGHQSPMVVTARLIYIRLHGPARQAYHGCYTEAQLEAWAGRVRRWVHGEGHKVCLFFDNDACAYAVKNALALKRKLGLSSNM